MSDEVEFKLSAPIRAHNQDVAVLMLRKPIGKDLMELGYPYILAVSDTDRTAVQMQPKVVGRYVSRLAKIPMSSVESMSVSDIQALQGVIMGFFPGLSEETGAPEDGPKGEA